MDSRRFDALARALTGAGSRRGLLGLLVTLPLFGGLLAGLEFADDADAKGRRKRRKKPHHHRKHTGNHKGKHGKKKCKPNSTARTCAGKCGLVKNTCKKTVNCGSCACDPPCDECLVCNEASGVCEPDPRRQGDACGEPGQVCQADGSCACDATSCPACQTCDTGQCQPDATLQHACDGPCPSGQWCDAGACAGIQATVTLPDCHSLCDGSTDVCGQTVTCPSCELCADQTGCFSNVLPEGPLGSGRYCSASGATSADVCTTNADCDPGDYCADTGATDYCAIICPY